MGITFRRRKSGQNFDSSYSLYDGGKIICDPAWNVGDEVSVMFEVSKEIVKAVDELDDQVCHVWNGFAHIPCKVVRKVHSISWKQVGQFQPLNTSVVLEADQGYWEDLLAWIIVGERPAWAAEIPVTG